MEAVLVNKKNNYTATNQTFDFIKESGVLVVLLLNNFEYSSTPFLDEIIPTDTDLSKYCMMLSEKSLQEEWGKEDDDRWNSF